MFAEWLGKLNNYLNKIKNSQEILAALTNTTDWVAYKQQKFSSQSSGGQKSKT